MITNFKGHDFFFKKIFLITANLKMISKSGDIDLLDAQGQLIPCQSVAGSYLAEIRTKMYIYVTG